MRARIFAIRKYREESRLAADNIRDAPPPTREIKVAKNPTAARVSYVMELRVFTCLQHSRVLVMTYTFRKIGWTCFDMSSWMYMTLGEDCSPEITNITTQKKERISFFSKSERTARISRDRHSGSAKERGREAKQARARDRCTCAARKRGSVSLFHGHCGGSRYLNGQLTRQRAAALTSVERLRREPARSNVNFALYLRCFSATSFCCII